MSHLIAWGGISSSATPVQGLSGPSSPDPDEGPQRQQRVQRPDEQQIDPDVGFGRLHQDQPFPGSVGQPTCCRRQQGVYLADFPGWTPPQRRPEQQVDAGRRQDMQRLLDQPAAQRGYVVELTSCGTAVGS